MKLRSLLQCLVTIVALVGVSAAQIPSETDTTSTPVPNAGHDYIQGMSETVNPANGSLSFRIGVPMPPGRRLTVPFSFAYDSNGSMYLGTLLCPYCSVPPSGVHWLTTNTMLARGGWSYSVPMLSVQNNSYSVDYTLPNEQEATFLCQGRDNFVFQDANGNRRNLGLAYYDANSECSSADGGEGTANNVLTALYGSLLSTTTGTWVGTESNAPGQVNPVTVSDGHGTSYSFGSALAPGSQTFCGSTDCTATTYPASQIADSNGNTVAITFSTVSEGNPTIAYTDSIGRPALSIPTFGGSPDNVSVYGFNEPYQVYWTTVTPSFSITMTPAPVSSNESCAAPGAQPSVPVVSKITLPNGQSYTFDYSNNPYGMVDKITYPTGGYVRYVWGLNPQSEYGQWDIVTSEELNGTSVPEVTGFCAYYYDTPAVLQRFVSFDGVHEVLEQTFNYTTTWGTGPSNSVAPMQWTQKTTTIITYDLVRGTQYQTNYTYGYVYADYQPGEGQILPQIPVENKIQYYGTTTGTEPGALLETVNKTWANERIMTQQQAILANGEMSETDWQYYPTTSFYSPTVLTGVPDESTTEMEQYRYDYDYGPGARGPLLRETYIPSYDNSFTLAQDILDRPNNVEVLDGNAKLVQERAYTYDSNGNLLSRSDWLNSSGSSVLTTAHQYDAYGNIISTTDPAKNTTSYSYQNNFAGTCSFTPDPSAYLTQITYPPTAGAPSPDAESFQYNCATGELANSTDENGNKTSYQYEPLLNRLSLITYPTDWGTETITYDDSPGSISVESRRLDGSGTTWSDAMDLFDGLFHQISESTLNAQNTWDQSETCYDGNERVMDAVYPYQSSANTGVPNWNCTSLNPGDTFVYDALGRETTDTHSDDSVITTTYTGRATDVKDEGNGSASLEHISQMDGLGRLAGVCEVANSTQNGVAPAACGLDYGATGFLTTYGYDASGSSGSLGNLTGVTQGAETRSFIYDMASRLTQSSNPETGTNTYQYDSDSSCPPPNPTSGTPNQYPGELISKSDARSIKTCMQYDARHRVLAKTYSDGTPSASYTYNQTSVYGDTLHNTVGRLSSESTGGTYPTGSVFSYDAMGHVIDNSQCTPSNCGSGLNSVTYLYDVLGSPLTSTDGWGHTLTYGYTTGQLTTVTSSLSAGTLLADIQYNAYGSAVSSAVGPVLTDTRTYTPRNWLSTISVSGPATPSTGTVTISGSEGNRVNTSATSGTGSVTISGSEKSTSVETSAGSQSHVTLTVSGDEQSVCLKGTDGGVCELYRYDSGSVSITVNGCTTTASYSEASSTTSVAAALASGFSCSTVTVSRSGTSLVFTSTAYSSSADYAYSTSSSTVYPSDFSPSFYALPTSGNMSGGAGPTYTTVYDSGTAAITVNGHADSYSWGSGATAGSIASGLASAINGDGSATVTASASGSVISVTTKATGTGTGYSLSASTTFNSSYFASSSFSLIPSGSALTSGSNATYTYDTGTASIVVNETSSSASYGQDDNGTTIAAALASAVNSNSPSVTATASGNVVTLASKTGGAYTDFSLSASATSSDGFSPSSFSLAPSGSTMTGGTGSVVYSVSVLYEPDGDVMSDDDLTNGNWSYTYDDFNRLNTAVSNTGLGCSETYDRYGNRLQQNTYEGSCFTPQYTSSGNNNHIDQFGYDAAGDVTNDGNYTYTYDAEGRIATVDGGNVATYIYDAEGRRIRKISSVDAEDDVYDLSGHVISALSTTSPVIWQRGELYAGGSHVATYMDGTTYFAHADWLGTDRVRSEVNGAIDPGSEWTSYPFGEGSLNPNPSPLHFTGKERDTESGNDYFGARYYASSMGRFLSPDWSDGPDTIPYASYGDPQTLNLYGYARNNPLRNIDPDGHDCIYATGVGSGYEVLSGDCLSDTDSGIYVNGTVTSANFNANNNTIGYTYTAYDTGSLGTGVIANVPTPQPMDEGAVTPGDDFLSWIVGGKVADFALGKIGGLFGRGGEAAVKGAEDALTPPAYANTPGGFVNWLKNLSHADTKLTSSQADAIVQQAKNLGVDVRLDPPHPGTNWDVPHLNIGREGQVHLEVPQGYSNSTIPQGSATRP